MTQTDLVQAHFCPDVANLIYVDYASSYMDVEESESENEESESENEEDDDDVLNYSSSDDSGIGGCD